MIDFNSGIEQPNKFLGSEKKTTILLDGKIYMLKYPDPIRNTGLKDIISYKNNQFSEHIGSNIFNACGFDAQETALGFFTDYTGKKKIVVGCVDFTQDGSVLYEIKKLANQIISKDEKLTATIEHVTLVINELKFIKDKQIIINSFWDMFVIDALIGNGDRHFGNWGLLDKGGELIFAPVYDCGSSLGALLDDEEMRDTLKREVSFKAKEYNITSCYHINGKRIFYHEIFKNPPRELLEAIKRTVPKIDMKKIHAIVDSTAYISETRKKYLKQSLTIRYEQILSPALKRAI
jgi:hypothetical protein